MTHFSLTRGKWKKFSNKLKFIGDEPFSMLRIFELTQMERLCYNQAVQDKRPERWEGERVHMSGNSCENCIFQCGKRNGKMDGERLFKFEARMSGRSRIISCLSNLYYAQASFVEYSRSEKGEIDGAVIRCDLGHGYGFDDGEEVVTLHPCETHRFIHSYTDTSEGTWDDDSFSVRLTLLPFDEKECCWCAEDE